MAMMYLSVSQFITTYLTIYSFVIFSLQKKCRHTTRERNIIKEVLHGLYTDLISEECKIDFLSFSKIKRGKKIFKSNFYSTAEKKISFLKKKQAILASIFSLIFRIHIAYFYCIATYLLYVNSYTF